MPSNITKYDDVIDSRDVIARFEELEAERAALIAAAAENDLEPEAIAKTELDLREWSEENGDEFKSLQDFLEQMRGNGGDEQWRGAWYPVIIVRDSYFTEYAQELCEDIGDMPKGFPNYIEIDWEATARNIRQDYTTAEFDGVTYWYR